ncbi:MULTISPECIES: VOC family protein [Nocardioides]|uniref:VOC family protein n=1 Tax=Nocardioides vastitatis TaxID=2568655 RepID=A0ABW0ZEV7_9ACTN|nr:VOC family protein [Nocardioides sp.]THI96918.1 VOC family protein [Nocardioides sp.]
MSTPADPADLGTPVNPLWLTAFLDNSAAHHDASVEFWRQATGYGLSLPRGDDGEFASLVPAAGDAYLKTQRLSAGADGVHIDVHVPDPRAAADRAVGLGATELTFVGVGYVVLTSPGGLRFCFVSHPAERKPGATKHPGGHESRVHQVAVDTPSAEFERELGFWQQVTGWTPRPSSEFEEFMLLGPGGGQPLGLLVQRLGEDDRGPVRAHLDWGTTNRVAETARHTALGATVAEVHRRWTVMREPTGRSYCLTDSDPA